MGGDKLQETILDDAVQEVILDDKKYLYKEDKDRCYFIDNSNNGVKIDISFSKNPDKNKKAKDGLKSFFSELYS
jgi:hypothetical protein